MAAVGSTAVSSATTAMVIRRVRSGSITSGVSHIITVYA